MANVLRIATTFLTPAEEPEPGWCDDCALPSLLVWHVVFEAGDRMLNDSLTTLRICTDCGRESWT